MITVFGEGRGFRVVWLLEEMGLPYRLRPVDLLAGVENDAEFLAINPAGFIPAIQDGDVTMVESIAIMEYLMARYGPTPLAPDPHDPAFPAYQQFLHLGEAGLAASIYFVVVSRNLAPEAERQNWGAGKALEVFESRLRLVTRQLARSPYLAGDAFTAADISVTYALELAQRTGAASPSARQSRPTSPAPPDAKPTSAPCKPATPQGSGLRNHASNKSGRRRLLPTWSSRLMEALMLSPSRTRLLLVPPLLVSMSLAHAVDVWTVGVNNTRQGWNKFETVLTPANVPRLKKIREFVVDEKIDVIAARRGRQALCVHHDEHGLCLRRQHRRPTRHAPARRAVRPGRLANPGQNGWTWTTSTATGESRRRQ